MAGIVTVVNRAIREGYRTIQGISEYTGIPEVEIRSLVENGWVVI